MKLQILVATMNQNNYELLEKMNITTDAIVCNQCDSYNAQSFMWKGNYVQWFDFAERGVGLNRNNALMRASADIVIFADDDLTYENDISAIITNAFNQIPEADVIIFNVRDENRSREGISSIGRVNRFNYLRYGTVRIAARLSKIRINGIFFNQCFGGGTAHSHGEDSLFLTSCLNSKLNIYTFPATIATLRLERESSWNTGYTEKYLKDQGILYRQISQKWWRLLCLQDSIRRRKSYGIFPLLAFRTMICGVREKM